MLLYDLVVRAYAIAIRAASLRNAKAVQWVRGRKDWRGALRRQMEKLHSAEVIWVHCASYGEFEQGRPLIEGLRKKYPKCALLLTFFSPSGYEAFNDWAGADLVFYLPLDTKRNARDFIGIVRPKAVIFIKYEFWLNYLRELKERNITTYLVSAVFKPHHPFFKWYGKVFRRSLSTFTHLFIQDEQSGRLLEIIGVKNYSVCGDTRFDRVLQIKEHFTPIPEVEKFKGSSKLIVGGSTWPRDEAMLFDAFRLLKNENLKLLIAPHNLGEKFIGQMEENLRKSGLRYSVFSKGVDSSCPVLILDTMGMLSQVYRYADCAYIGGGFNGGLHNSLEASVYGIPVVFFGARYHKFNEAVELLKLGAAIRVKSAQQLAGAFSSFLENEKLRRSVEESLTGYFRKNSDSTGRILDAIVIAE